MKSSYELAMERLGDAGPRLSEEQKAALAEIDAKYLAQVAEKEILFAERLHAARLAGDAGVVEALTSELAEERLRIEHARNREKDRCRAKEIP